MTEADKALTEMDAFSTEVFRCLEEISGALNEGTYEGKYTQIKQRK